MLGVVTSWRSQSHTQPPKHLITLNISTNLAAILQSIGDSAWLIQSTPPEVQSKGPAAFTGLPLLRHWCSKLTRPVLQVLYHHSRYRSGEPCIGHISSCIHNRSPFIPLSSTYSASSTVIPLSFRAFFTPSDHLYRGLPLALFPLLQLFITFFVNLTSSILSMCPNHLKTLLSALPDKSTFIPVLSLITVFLTLSRELLLVILRKHLISNTFNFFLSHSLKPHVLLHTTQSAQSPFQ